MILNPDLAFLVCLGIQDLLLWENLVQIVGNALAFAFCYLLSLVLAGVVVSDYGLSVMQDSVSVLLGDLFSLCTHICRCSWETSSLVVVFGYVALWP